MGSKIGFSMFHIVPGNIHFFPTVFFDNAVHAAVIAINEAVDKQVAADTMKALHNPNAMLITLINENQDLYQETLYNAKQSKNQSAMNKVRSHE